MGHCLGSRTASVLGNEDWKNVPWQSTGVEKDSLQLLYDIGFDLAAVLERTDAVLQQSNWIDNALRQANVQALWQSCLSIFSQLEDWYKQHWPNRSSAFSNTAYSEIPASGAQSPQFGSLWEATNLVYYWTFKLLLDQNVLALSTMQNQFPPPQTMPSSSRGKIPSSRNTSLAQAGLTPSQAEQISTSSLQLASDIVAAAPFFLADDTGWLGPQRLFFPLRQVMGFYGKIQSPKIVDAKGAFFACLGRLRTTCADKSN